MSGDAIDKTRNTLYGTSGALGRAGGAIDGTGGVHWMLAGPRRLGSAHVIPLRPHAAGPLTICHTI